MAIIIREVRAKIDIVWSLKGTWMQFVDVAVVYVERLGRVMMQSGQPQQTVSKHGRASHVLSSAASRD